MFYRKFNAIVDKFRCLKSRREVLKAHKYKYNIIQGYALKRNLLASSYYSPTFFSIISKGVVNKPVEAH